MELPVELTRLLIAAVAVAVFAYVAWIDKKTMEIPDKCHLILLGLAMVEVAVGAGAPLLSRGLGLIAISLPMMLANMVREDSFGGGDIKMCAAAGFLLGASLMVAGALMALMLAGMYGGMALALKHKKPQDTFPLGPFLSLGFVATMLGEIWAR